MILVDSSVLIDVLGAPQDWTEWSAGALAAAMDRAPLAINALIYAEVSIGFSTRELLNAALEPLDLQFLNLPYDAGFLAGRAFIDYRRRGGDRKSPLPDFYIGAHAAVAGLQFLTRDPRPVRSYFPTVQLIAPDMN